MCSCPTKTAEKSQRVEVIGRGTGRPEEPREELRPTEPRSLQNRHPGMDSVLLTGVRTVREEERQI